MSNESIEAFSTGCKSETKKLTWKIENFELIRSSDHLVFSQKIDFHFGQSISFPTEWRLYFTCRRRKKENDEQERKWIEINIKLVNKPPDVKQVFTSHSLKIRDKDKSDCYKFNSGVYNHLDKNGADRCFPTIISSDGVCNVPLNLDGCLILEMEFGLYVPKVYPDFGGLSTTQEEYKVIFGQKLQADLGTLLDNPLDNCKTKATIISKDMVKISVNREILSARSPVFEKMFGIRMKEAKTGIIDITDVGSRAMNLLLKFIYTGILPTDWKEEDILPELVYAAHKYQLTDLLEFLDKVLGSVCTKDNCVQMLKLTMKLSLKAAEKDLLEKMKNYTVNSEDFVLFANQFASSEGDEDDT